MTDVVAVTSGGKWDPTDPNITFLVISVRDATAHLPAQVETILLAVDALPTSRAGMADVARLCAERKVLLDSGVYALASAYSRRHGVSMAQAFAVPPDEVEGWSEHYDRYCSVVSRFASDLWGVIELDQGGAEAATTTRERITADTGVTPIPVYHPLGDDWTYYDSLAAAHDRICVGGLAGRIPSSVRLRLCWTAAERARAYPHLWTHLLGVTPSPMTLSLGLRGSNDSSGWLSPVRWAQQWRSWTMLQRIGDMPSGMTYVLDRRHDPQVGHSKAMWQCAADAYFQQRTLAALGEDTHP